MATSHNPKPQRRRRTVGDRSATGAATPPGTDPTPDNSSGQPNALGASPMADHPSLRRTVAAAQAHPDPPDPATGQAPAPVGVSAAERALMRARLAAMATPRDGDSPQMAALRAILRDEALMAHVTANVEQWPPLSDEQRDTLGALLHRTRKRPAAQRPGRQSGRRAA